MMLDLLEEVDDEGAGQHDGDVLEDQAGHRQPQPRGSINDLAWGRKKPKESYICDPCCRGVTDKKVLK